MKALNPKLAVTVGEKAAIVFQHICFWMQTQNVETVYRTNKELASDLEGMFSEQQIQRAKKKLLDSGMITVSFNKKNVWNRTTHYTLTEKGKQFLLNMSVEKKEKPSVKPTPIKDQKQQANKNAPTQQSAEAKANQESFKEGFTNKNAIGMPEDARAKLLGLLKKKPTDAVVEAPKSDIIDDEWEKIVEAEREARGFFSDVEQEHSQEDYDACDIAMMQSLDTPVTESKLSLSELMSKAFKNAVTPDQEKRYNDQVMMQQMVANFKEDY